MKTSKRLLAYGLVFALLLGTAFLLQTAAPRPVTANVIFEPNTIDLEAPGWTVKTVVVTVWFDKRYDGKDIDPKTVLIDGSLEPKGGWKHTWTERIRIDGKNKLVFRFKVSGSSLRELLWNKIIHMAIPGPEADIPLEVTGLLTRGAEFSGTGYVTVYFSEEIPPPPPE